MRKLLYTLLTLSILTLSSCDPDDNNEPAYTVPETYNFENVSYSGQTTRILLLDSIGKLINKAKYVKVTKAQLEALYKNSNGLFTSQTDPAKIPNLQSKMAPGAETQLIEWFTLVETHSPMVNQTSSKAWFITPDGLDVSQLVQKTLMGSVLYYRAVNDYLDPIALANNETVVPGQGTNMQHYWDEAFGYFGAPIDFKTYTAADITAKYKDLNGNGKQDIPSEKYFFHANYALTIDELTKSLSDKTTFRTSMMENFLLGRAAINNKDNAKRDFAKDAIIADWDKLLAMTTIKYARAVKERINTASTKLDDIESLQHEWAEGRGFLNSLQYNPYRKLKNVDFTEISSLYGQKPSETTAEKLNTVITKLQTLYGISDTQLTTLK